VEHVGQCETQSFSLLIKAGQTVFKKSPMQRGYTSFHESHNCGINLEAIRLSSDF